MNYEFRIKTLEAEMAHVHRMLAIYREHINTVDKGHQYPGTRPAALETINPGTLHADLERLTTNVDALVAALSRERPNEKDAR